MPFSHAFSKALTESGEPSPEYILLRRFRPISVRTSDEVPATRVGGGYFIEARPEV
jgi:hypothetical protein